MGISRSHPLRRLFNELVERHFFHDVMVRERAVRKHIGDYTLFMTGVFPENVAGQRRRLANALRAENAC